MKYCCEYFPKIALQFNWFSYTDENGKQVYLMPCLIQDNGMKIRVNNCPVCGVKVRDITIPEDEFKEIMKV